jgi:hypothetical protein
LANLPVERQRRHAALQQLPNASQKLAVAKRLADKVVAVGVVGNRATAPGDEQAFQHRMADPRTLRQLDSVQAVREPDIGDQQVEFLALDHAESDPARGSRSDVKTAFTQDLDNGVSNPLVVFDHEYRGGMLQHRRTTPNLQKNRVTVETLQGGEVPGLVENSQLSYRKFCLPGRARRSFAVQSPATTGRRSAQGCAIS